MTNSPTELRNQVSQLVSEASDETKSDAHQKARAIAKKIEDPWFRCQAIAWIARYADAKDVLSTAKQAMDAAGDCEDAYQQAAGSAWVVRALLERDQRDNALTMLELGLHAAPRIGGESSRSEALFLIYQAAFDLSEEFRRSTLFALAELYEQNPHWRIERNYRDALVMAKSLDADFVAKLARGHNDKQRARLEKALANDTAEPRTFFW